MFKSTRFNTTTATISTTVLLLVVYFSSPEANLLAVGVFFAALAGLVLSVMRLIFQLPIIQNIMITIATLVLVALSSLRQLTTVDVIVVVAVTLLVQLLYRVRNNSND